MLNAPETSFRKALVVFLLGGMAPLAAHAQEVQKKWDSHLSLGQSRATEAAVQQDIKTFFAHFEDDKPFTWEVKRQRVQANKTVYDYRVKPERIVTTDWVYTYADQEYAEEDAVRTAILNDRASDPQCAATTLVEDEWAEIGGIGRGDDGSVTHAEKKFHYTTNHYFAGTQECTAMRGWLSAQRDRSAKCPNGFAMLWDESIQMCSIAEQDEPATASVLAYTSTPLPPQQCPVGNPCDPTTGDKSQPELDFDFGWVSSVATTIPLPAPQAGHWAPAGRIRTTSG